MSETIDERPGPAIYPEDFGKGTPVQKQEATSPTKTPVESTSVQKKEEHTTVVEAKTTPIPVAQQIKDLGTGPIEPVQPKTTTPVQKQKEPSHKHS